jgi:carboxylesterase
MMKDLTIDLQGGEHAVLLIHGLTGSPFEFNPLARKLHQNGFTVKAPCLAGHGQTLGDLTTTTWHDWYETVHGEFKELKKYYETVSVAGLCMGALLALYLANEEGDEVSSIATLSTTLFYDGWSLPWYKFLLPLFYLPPFKYLASYEERPPYGVKNERIRKKIEIALKKNTIAYSSFPTQSMHELFKLVKVVKKTVHKVKVPTLILHALEDDVASIKNAEYIEKNIGSPIVRKVFLDNTYHMLPLDNQKERVAEETIRFFRENIRPVGNF